MTTRVNVHYTARDYTITKTPNHTCIMHLHKHKNRTVLTVIKSPPEPQAITLLCSITTADCEPRLAKTPVCAYTAQIVAIVPVGFRFGTPRPPPTCDRDYPRSPRSCGVRWMCLKSQKYNPRFPQGRAQKEPPRPRWTMVPHRAEAHSLTQQHIGNGTAGPAAGSPSGPASAPCAPTPAASSHTPAIRRGYSQISCLHTRRYKRPDRTRPRGRRSK